MHLLLMIVLMRRLGKKHVVRSFPELGHYLQVFIYLISSLKIRYKAYDLSSLVRVVVCRALSASINLKKNSTNIQFQRGPVNVRVNRQHQAEGIRGAEKKSSSTFIFGAVMGSLCHMTNKKFIIAV